MGDGDLYTQVESKMAALIAHIWKKDIKEIHNFSRLHS